MKLNENHKITFNNNKSTDVVDIYLEWLVKEKGYTDIAAELMILKTYIVSDYITKIYRTKTNLFCIISIDKILEIKEKLFADHGVSDNLKLPHNNN